MVRQRGRRSYVQRKHEQKDRSRSHGRHLSFGRTSKYLLFSQTQSSSSVSGISSHWNATLHGLLYAFGPLIVICTSIVPKFARRKRSTTWSASLRGWPASSSRVFSWIPVVSTTSVSPSQRPTE